MRALFRCDASPAIGGGHAMRCLTLARSLKVSGWRCEFAVNEAAIQTVPALAGEALTFVNPNTSATNLQQLWPEDVDWLVVDHYGLGADWETQCRGWAKAIMVIDDLADRPHDCDLLLDQTFGRRAEDYSGLVPAGCHLLTGSDYALLRPAFAHARSTSLARRNAVDGLRRILVTLGAADPENYSGEVLRGIAASGLAVSVDVVLGAGAPHREVVRRQVATMPQGVSLHVGVEDMATLMATADLAIGSAGSSTWERCCLGLPSLLIVTADNQRYVAQTVCAAGAARLVPGPRAELAEQIALALQALSTNRAELRAISAKSSVICDGRGADRIGLALTPPGKAKDGRRIALRLAEPDDEDLVLEWQQHPTTRRHFQNPSVPTAAEHHAWFAARLRDPDCLLTLITADGATTGVLRLAALPPVAAAPEAQAYEVSILIGPNHRGLGIAMAALRFLRRWQGTAVLVARVLPENKASAALFQAADYRAGAGGLLYSYPPQTAVGPHHPAAPTPAESMPEAGKDDRMHLAPDSARNVKSAGK